MDFKRILLPVTPALAVVIAAVCTLGATAARGELAAAPAVPVAAEAAATPPGPAPSRFGTILPAEHSQDLLAHWAARRDYLRDRDERRAEDEEQHVRELKKELAVDNLFTIGSALVRESMEALAAGSPALARQRCALAVEFAPALPDAHYCLARALLSANGTAFKAATNEVVAGLAAARQDPRVSRAALANALTVLLIGTLLASVAFVLLLLTRYAQLYVHDLHHFFPAGARRWQTRLLAFVLVASPLLLHLGPVPLLFTALLACALYASTVEALVGCAVLLAVAAAPGAIGGIARVAAFGGPASDVYLLEHGSGVATSIARLQSRLDDGQQTEFAVAFALAHKAKREGDLPRAQEIYGRAIQSPGANSESLAAAHNDLGNVFLLEGDGARASEQYRTAIEFEDDLAAAHFNLSRALNLASADQLQEVQKQQQRALDLDREGIEAFTEGSLQVNRKSNRFVIDVPLPQSSFAALESGELTMASDAGDEASAALGGPLPASLAVIWPIAACLAFLALHLARGRIKLSGRCDRCGREVCKRCDADARPAEALCAQCVNVFVRRTNVDPAERIRKEIAVHLYQRRRTTLLRLVGVISGAGHVLLGYPLRGIAWLVLTGSLCASVLLWRGVAHDPIAIRSGISLLRVSITAAWFVAIYALCLRDLLARQRAEGG